MGFQHHPRFIVQDQYLTNFYLIIDLTSTKTHYPYRIKIPRFLHADEAEAFMRIKLTHIVDKDEIVSITESN